MYLISPAMTTFYNELVRFRLLLPFKYFNCKYLSNKHLKNKLVFRQCYFNAIFIILIQCLPLSRKCVDTPYFHSIYSQKNWFTLNKHSYRQNLCFRLLSFRCKNYRLISRHLITARDESIQVWYWISPLNLSYVVIIYNEKETWFCLCPSTK